MKITFRSTNIPFNRRFRAAGSPASFIFYFFPVQPPISLVISCLVNFMSLWDPIGPFSTKGWRSWLETPVRKLIHGQSERVSVPHKGNIMHLTMKYKSEKQNSKNIENYQRYRLLTGKREKIDFK